MKVKITEVGSFNILFCIGDEQQRPLALAILNINRNLIGNLLVDSEARRKGLGIILLNSIT